MFRIFFILSLKWGLIGDSIDSGMAAHFIPCNVRWFKIHVYLHMHKIKYYTSMFIVHCSLMDIIINKFRCSIWCQKQARVVFHLKKNLFNIYYVSFCFSFNEFCASLVQS